MAKDRFTFEISLSVLNHLGRNLYRSFMTVLGEAISNSWDADAKNVWVYINRDSSSMIIKDDGKGMNTDDFQNMFLKIGYSKRKDGHFKSRKGRPFIGRKGIGKLALLSCAEKITIISKTKATDYTGGIIDNSGLDKAIEQDLTPDKYPLEEIKLDSFAELTKDHSQGTIIYFEHIREGIYNRVEYLRKIVALNFRFSLIDKTFNIYFDNKIINFDDLDDLATKTEFVWNLNNLDDPFIRTRLKNIKVKIIELKVKHPIKGFIASVEKPKDLKIRSTDHKVSVDLFVNGRLREKDILKHIPTARVVESYLYGQIHYNELDDEKDRFTSSRENIVSDDPKFNSFLEIFKSEVIAIIFDQWDKLRRDHKKDGDPDNPSITPKDRKSEELFNAVADEYALSADTKSAKKIKDWVNLLHSDATFNFSSYADCFISENLLRLYIENEKILLPAPIEKRFEELLEKEKNNKLRGNVNIELRQNKSKLSYLDMDNLASTIDPHKGGPSIGLTNDSKQYKPIRDALMHTALLQSEAKEKLTTVYHNIKGRLITLLKTD